MRKETTFLDEKRNVVKPKDAIMVVIRTYDDQGNLIKEEWGVKEEQLKKWEQKKGKQLRVFCHKTKFLN